MHSLWTLLHSIIAITINSQELAMTVQQDTYFLGTDGTEILKMSGLLSISLYKGMEITIHSHPATYVVLEWSYHVGHPDERAGLRVTLALAG